MTKIIIDSTTDLPDSFLKKHDISVLPLRVSIESEDYIDKVNITIEKVYDSMRKGNYPKTSMPNLKDIYDLFQNYASKGIDFIFYCFSSKLSGTYETSHLTVEGLKKEYPNVKMKVIDTESGSLATGLIALQGAKMLEKGLSYEEVIKISEENIKNIEHIFTIDDLGGLLKGGRIKKVEAVVGSVLNIKPILDIQDGEIQVIKKVRGRNKALKTIIDIMEERIKGFPNQVIGLVHAGDIEDAFKIKDMLIERLGHDNIIIETIGSVLASHLGIGALGLFFLNKEPKIYIK